MLAFSRPICTLLVLISGSLWAQAPVAVFSPSTMSFAPVVVGSSSTQTATLTNTGTSAVAINSIYLYSQTGIFSQISDCGNALASGAHCTFTITFAPAISGQDDRATLDVQGYTSPAYEAQLQIDGFGLAPSTVNAIPGAITFGVFQQIGTTSPPQTVTVLNTTSGTVELGPVSITGLDPNAFVAMNGCGATIAPGGSCSIYVSFTPLLEGTRTASLLIGNSVAPQTVSLLGISSFRYYHQFEIVNSLTGKVLDIAGGSASNGTLIRQNALNGSEQQRWSLSGLGSYTIVNVSTNRGIEVMGQSTANGALIQESDTPSYFPDSKLYWQLVPVDDVHYKIVNAGSGKALDVPGGSKEDGTLIQQWTFLGNPQQLWTLVPVLSYTISNSLSGKVLDTMGGAGSDGTLIQQNTLSGARQQQWQFIPVGSGYYAIMNRLTGKVLDVLGPSTSNGAQIQEWDYLGGLNQQWRLLPVGVISSADPLGKVSTSFQYQVVNRLSGKVLDDTAYSTNDGTFVQQWDYLGGQNQQWQFNLVQYYTILSDSSLGLSGALDVIGGSTANGAGIQQWLTNGLQQQEWQFVPTGNGSFAIANNLTGKVLDVTGESTTNGALVQQWDYLGGSNQQWQLIRAPLAGWQIVNVHSNKVLDVVGSSTANGARVQQWDNLGGLNQSWDLSPLFYY